MVSLPPSGMASRALSARLINAFSSWFGSALVRQRPARQHGFERHRFAERAAQELAEARHQLVGVERLRRQRLLAREGEQTVGQRCGALGALLRHVARAGDARGRGRGRQVRELAVDDLKPAEHDGQEVVEVVGDAAGELPDRLHLLRLAQRFLGLLAGFVLRLKLARAFLDRDLRARR